MNEVVEPGRQLGPDEGDDPRGFGRGCLSSDNRRLAEASLIRLLSRRDGEVSERSGSGFRARQLSGVLQAERSREHQSDEGVDLVPLVAVERVS